MDMLELLFGVCALIGVSLVIFSYTKPCKKWLQEL